MCYISQDVCYVEQDQKTSVTAEVVCSDTGGSGVVVRTLAEVKLL